MPRVTTLLEFFGLITSSNTFESLEEQWCGEGESPRPSSFKTHSVVLIMGLAGVAVQDLALGCVALLSLL